MNTTRRYNQEIHTPAIRAAYPVESIPQDTREKVRAWHLAPVEGYEPMLDTLWHDLTVVHELMRQAHEARVDYLVEWLERERESSVAQLSAALALREEEQAAETRG